MVPTNSFNMSFWLLTLSLVFFWAIVLSTASPSKHTSHQQMLAIHGKASRNYERNCKTLCKECGCMGFYCGEECICECNNNIDNNSKENSDTECLASMQSNAERLKIPFQLLIQGPSSNHFVRNALKYSQDKYGLVPPANILTNRMKRSTALIYKPNQLTNELSNQGHSNARKIANNKNESAQREKRQIGQLDWFNDIASSLVRPAPLNARKKSSQSLNSDEQLSQAYYKRSSTKNDMDRSWFADNPNVLLRPAPLFKKQRYQSNSDKSEDTGFRMFPDKKDDDSSYELAMRTVSKIPKVIKETLRSFQDSSIASETGDNLGEILKESANILQSQLSENNLDFIPTSGAELRDNIQQTLSHIFPGKSDDEQPQSMSMFRRSTQPKMTGKNKFIWFRPVRFLQRVQQAIN